MATKRTTPTTSTIKRETTSAPKRSQRDSDAEAEPNEAKRETTSAPKRSQRDAEVEIAPHEVARRAFEKFMERGGEHGYDVQDWLAAEAEIRAGRD